MQDTYAATSEAPTTTGVATACGCVARRSIGVVGRKGDVDRARTLGAAGRGAGTRMRAAPFKVWRSSGMGKDEALVIRRAGLRGGERLLNSASHHGAAPGP